MDRYDFVCDWFSASPVSIEKYTLNDARADMRNLRAHVKSNPEAALPYGLSVGYLYKTMNELIKKQAEG